MLTRARQRWCQGWWLWLGAGALLAGLLFGLLLPVYSDEVVWRFAERAAIDGFDKLSADTCGPNTLAVPPWFMWPARYYSFFFNAKFASPLWVRLSGVTYALALMALLWRLVGRLTADAGQRATMRAVGGALLALGVMPLLLVWSRPEQPILLCFIGALLIAQRGWRDDDGADAVRAAGRVAAILLLAVIALSYHMKATLLMPAFALAMLSCARGRVALAWRLAGVVVLAGCALSAAHYWASRFACPADPAMARNITSQNVTALFLKFHDWPLLWSALWHNADLFTYFNLAAPDPRPIAPWVPRDLVTAGQMTVWRCILIAVWAVTIAGGMLAVCRGGWRGWRARRWDWRLAMAALLFALASVWGVTQTAKNVYDATFMLPLWLVASWLALAGGGLSARGWRVLRGFAMLVAVVAPVSVALMLTTYAPSFIRAAGEKDGVAGQAFSIPAFRYGEARADILGAARACHIPLDRRLRAPMIDENSYFAFMGAYRPQFHLGVVGVWHGGITKPTAYLDGLHSDGAVLACRNLPPGLRSHAKRVGDFCCLAPPGW